MFPEDCFMSHSIYGADRAMHLKIVVVALACAIVVAGVAVGARLANVGAGTPLAGLPGDAPLAKASGRITVTVRGNLPTIR